MDWYYAEGQQQRGPVSDADLDNLARAGTIRGDTLVWREGMDNWQAYEQVRLPRMATMPAAGPVAPAAGPVDVPPPDGAVCVQCGNIFAKDQVIRFGDSWVCGNCKSSYVQRLKEGAALPGVVEYAGFWTRFGAKFVDRLIMRFVGMFLGIILGARWPARGNRRRR
jgi:hypothetical protein